MENIEQYNEEQLKLLYLTVAGMSSGICLFTAERAAEQTVMAGKLQEMLGGVCVLDVCQMTVEPLPSDIGRIRSLLTKHPDCRVVILCNLQLCGIVMGDKEYIEKLNYMRDQLLALDKVWILGMAPYFAAELSRSARDIYSCISDRFSFRSKENLKGMFWVDGIEKKYIGKRNFTDFQELLPEIKKLGDSTNSGVLLKLVDFWLDIYDCCVEDVNRSMERVVAILYQRGMQKKFTAAECISWQILVQACEVLGRYDKALQVERCIEQQAMRLIPEKSPEFAGILVRLGKLECLVAGEEVGEGSTAEGYLQTACSIYEKLDMKETAEGVTAMMVHGWIKGCQKDFENALDVYRKAEHEISKTGKKTSVQYAVLWVNQGSSWMDMKHHGNAFREFEKALQYLDKPKYVQSRLRMNVLLNLSLICNMLGAMKWALRYAKEALEISKVRISSKYSECLKCICKLCAEDCEKRSIEDLRLEFEGIADKLLIG